MKEIFKKIGQTSKSKYYVSNLGNIKRTCGSKKYISKGSFNSYTGYFYVHVNGKSVSVHRLVAENFVENPENKQFVDHINSDRTDNRAENLRWVTRRENNSTEHAKQLHSINHKSILHKEQFVKAISIPLNKTMYFLNAAEASRYIGCSHVMIHNCLNPESYSKTAYGWIFEYVDQTAPECKEYLNEITEKRLENERIRIEKKEAEKAERKAIKEAAKQKKIEIEEAEKAARKEAKKEARQRKLDIKAAEKHNRSIQRKIDKNKKLLDKWLRHSAVDMSIRNLRVEYFNSVIKNLKSQFKEI